MQYGEFITVSALQSWSPRLRPDGYRVPRRLKKRLGITGRGFWRGVVVATYSAGTETASDFYGGAK